MAEYGTYEYVFDATTVAPDTGFDPVPADTYSLQCSAAGVKDAQLKQGQTPEQQGKYYETVWEVMDGEYKGRKIFKTFNIKNESAQAVEIAQKQLSACCHVTGRYNVDFRDGGKAMIGAQCKAKVTNDGERNDIKTFYDMNGNPAGRQGGVSTNGQTPAAVMQPTGVPGTFGAPTGLPAPAPTAQPAPLAFAAPAPAAAAPSFIPPQAAPVAAPAPVQAPAPIAAPAPAPVQQVWSIPQGWTQHPDNPDYYYAGDQVKTIPELQQMYPLQPATPAVPAAPVAPAAPAFPAGAPVAFAAPAQAAAPAFGAPQAASASPFGAPPMPNM